jgi:hypothetical protein
MLISRTGKSHNIKIGNTKIEQVSNFKYLRAWINQEVRIEEEITNRIASAGKCFQSIKTTLLNRKEISKRTKVVIYKTMYRPILTYSCESWMMNSNNQSAIQACEMWFLRKIEGKARSDRIRNKIIRDIVGVQSVQEYVERSQLRWYGHVNRMDDKRIVKRVYEARETGKRPR